MALAGLTVIEVKTGVGIYAAVFVKVPSPFPKRILGVGLPPGAEGAMVTIKSVFPSPFTSLAVTEVRVSEPPPVLGMINCFAANPLPPVVMAKLPALFP